MAQINYIKEPPILPNYQKIYLLENMYGQLSEYSWHLGYYREGYIPRFDEITKKLTVTPN
jgi:hypothetical protein